mmetsp:Transcript_43361/g.85542  ORF Transcript_43361/g.85542 Transcript_43361/m.85542 type:complete len:247 (+) Transcript_43361:221-961(+)
MIRMNKSHANEPRVKPEKAPKSFSSFASRVSSMSPRKKKTVESPPRKNRSFSSVVRHFSFTQKKPLYKGRPKVPGSQSPSDRNNESPQFDIALGIGLPVNYRVAATSDGADLSEPRKRDPVIGEVVRAPPPIRNLLTSTIEDLTLKRSGWTSTKMPSFLSVAELHRKANEAPVSFVLSLLLLVTAGLFAFKLVEVCAFVFDFNSVFSGGSSSDGMASGLPRGAGSPYSAFENRRHGHGHPGRPKFL